MAGVRLLAPRLPAYGPCLLLAVLLSVASPCPASNPAVSPGVGARAVRGAFAPPIVPPTLAGELMGLGQLSCPPSAPRGRLGASLTMTAATGDASGGGVGGKRKRTKKGGGGVSADNAGSLSELNGGSAMPEIAYTDVVEASDLPVDNVQEGKVKVFGGWVDTAVAGRDGLHKAETRKVERALMDKYLKSTNGNATRATELVIAHVRKLEEAERCFAQGTKGMRAGQYQAAATAFVAAVAAVPEGRKSREGGFYTIWLAQALDAKGEKYEAIKMLKAAMGHSDRDVRRVAEGLEFIMMAPKLELDESNFAWIELEKLQNIAEGGKGAMYATMEKMPEKYSLEWYMLQKAPKKQLPSDADELKLVLGASVGVLGGMWAYAQLFH